MTRICEGPRGVFREVCIEVCPKIVPTRKGSKRPRGLETDGL